MSPNNRRSHLKSFAPFLINKLKTLVSDVTRPVNALMLPRPDFAQMKRLIKRWGKAKDRSIYGAIIEVVFQLLAFFPRVGRVDAW